MPQYLESANTLEKNEDGSFQFVSDIPPTKSRSQEFALPHVIINPDMSAVAEIPAKYWKRVGNTIRAMNAGEKNAVDAADSAVRETAIGNLESVDVRVLAKALVAAGLITKATLIQKIKEVLNG